MHSNNLHKNGYNFKSLTEVLPELSDFVIINKYGKTTIDFSHAEAVKSFNKALLKKHYQIDVWDIPEGYLCPPVPSRMDYLHYINDLIKPDDNGGTKILDIGTGANSIYPLLGSKVFNWKFVATEIDQRAFTVAKSLIDANKLSSKVELRFQKNDQLIFKGVIKEKEKFDCVICNPPFFESKEQANLANVKKWKKLGYKSEVNQNFGGQKNELWCEGGAYRFISDMIVESKNYSKHFNWLSVLVSKKSHLPGFYKTLERLQANYKVIEMEHGHKKSRILCWRFQAL